MKKSFAYIIIAIVLFDFFSIKLITSMLKIRYN